MGEQIGTRRVVYVLVYHNAVAVLDCGRSAVFDGGQHVTVCVEWSPVVRFPSDVSPRY